MLARSFRFIMAVNVDRFFSVLQTSRSRTIVKYTYLLITFIAFLSSPLLGSSKGELKRKQFRCVAVSIHNDSMEELVCYLRSVLFFNFSFVFADFKYVTCGSVLKLLNPKHNVRLHSHEVKYGSGSGQQVPRVYARIIYGVYILYNLTWCLVMGYDSHG